MERQRLRKEQPEQGWDAHKLSFPQKCPGNKCKFPQVTAAEHTELGVPQQSSSPTVLPLHKILKAGEDLQGHQVQIDISLR